jgi:hypothetical protein
MCQVRLGQRTLRSVYVSRVLLPPTFSIRSAHPSQPTFCRAPATASPALEKQPGAADAVVAQRRPQGSLEENGNIRRVLRGMARAQAWRGEMSSRQLDTMNKDAAAQ